MMGVLFPITLLHTYFGGYAYFNADMTNCRKDYDGEVIYILCFMFEVSMCFVYLLLLLCILVPVWTKNVSFFRRRRANIHQDALNGENEFDQALIQQDHLLPINLNDERPLNAVERRALRLRAEQQRQQLEELLAFLENDIQFDEEFQQLIRRQRHQGLSTAEINEIDADTITEEQSHSLKEECCSICLDHFSA